MTDPNLSDQYKLFHYTLDHTQIDNPVDFSGDYESTNLLELQRTGFKGDLPTAAYPGGYQWRRREITGTITYDASIDNTKEVYVWGTGGGSTSVTDGWPLQIPYYTSTLPYSQEAWCEVTDATGRTSKRPGIRHGFSRDVKVHTYQYDLKSADGATSFGHFPPDDQLGLNITVFGATAPHSIVNSQDADSSSFLIWPSVASGTLNLMLDSKCHELEIVDALGRIVYEKRLDASDKTIEIQTSNYANGFYSCRVFGSASSKSIPFVICH